MPLYSVRSDLASLEHGQNGYMLPLSVYGDVHLKFDVLILNVSTKSPVELNQKCAAKGGLVGLPRLTSTLLQSYKHITFSLSPAT